MCGIAGIFNYAEPERPIDRELLIRMTRSLEHRGPDDEDFYVDGPIGLGHRRLTIVDLTATGRQPMPDTEQSCWITYNGEFYNHDTFRRRLISRGHTFRGTSDTETLVHLLAAEGPESLADAAGIFAFAFWDSRKRELTLARDPLGVKQLYYYDDGRRIIFASEIKALLVCPDVPRAVDTEALNQYLHFHTALFDRTFFKDIKQLRAGEYLQLSRTRWRRHIYWKVEDFEPHTGTPEARINELRELLLEVVSDQLMSDVPVGAFFSGGIDSSSVAAMASRTGKPPACFGVHFSNQGVVDERPYQEAAAKALGLDLHLITLDGSTFPQDLMRLTYFQDQPVIGPAMFPMSVVSQLAASQVKVCLGGQAADEIFGGYARYGLTHPWQIMKSWFAGRTRVNGNQGTQNSDPVKVGGNLGRQVADRRNMRRLFDNVAGSGGPLDRYFRHFAKVPESVWAGVFGPAQLVSRSRCYELFQETIAASPATDPADKVMHWDLQTYLTGLFQQDDRMSMASSLESRVPLADPRVVKFAFRSGFDLKFRAGATKWLLRQAVADVLPEFVLNRRKIGFDTPAERWMKQLHPDFIRDLLLSTEARQRGLWNHQEIESWIDRSNHPQWFDVIWKVVSIEAWAKTFLTRPTPPVIEHDDLIPEKSAPVASKSLRNSFQEVRELGLSQTISRAAWEVKTRSGLGSLLEPSPERHVGRLAETNGKSKLAIASASAGAVLIQNAVPLIDPAQVAAVMGQRISPEAISDLRKAALDAVHGRILCFGRWTADFGRPIDWHLNPLNGRRWPASAHWSKALKQTETIGEVKLTWEPGRFPQAYLLARAAAFTPELKSELAAALTDQIKTFISQNPFGRGVHWNSGQEIAIRLMAWTFSLAAFNRQGEDMGAAMTSMLGVAYESGLHIERNLQYARTVNNNHLLSEAIGLYLVSQLLPAASESPKWKREAMTILAQEAERQFHSDGGYIMQSHNYHRSVLQIYLWAWILCRANHETPPPPWGRAMMNSLDFLFAQQNPADGRLPNYGANDGALPLVLSTCDFSDFRPVLQALSVATRGERCYEPGPWDEATAWLLGAESLEVPLRPRARTSISFTETGQHVLRGNKPENFAIFRCGTVVARYSQIDMLHLDVWWRGLNVLVDAGSYLYNGPEHWHSHFSGTASHNTLEVDGRDQMLPYRRFKNLYWTKASLINFDDDGEYALCAGEHYGFKRYPGTATHRRSVLSVKDDLWIVVDRISGEGPHACRLHWLCGEFPYLYGHDQGCLSLETAQGRFSILTLDDKGQPLPGDVVSGQSSPARGWISRYYGEKSPALSLAVERTSALPVFFISILGAGGPTVEVKDGIWTVSAGAATARFRIEDGLIVVDKEKRTASR